MLVGLFALGALLTYWMVVHSAHSPATNRAATALPASSSLTQTQAAKSPAPASATGPAPPTASNPTSVVQLSQREPPSDPRQLVATLSEIDFSAGSITSAQAAQWKQSLQKLIQQGAAAVPAIGDFLSKNVDVDFDSSKGGDLLGYASLRFTLLDVLRQITGPESVAASLQVLQATADPKEIAIVAKNLEQQAPGQYRQTAVAAAREALSQAARGLLEGQDVGPLFEVLQQYGGAGVAADLEKAGSKWNFYSTIALGGLPGGAGIPALARMAQETTIQNVMALRVLAQMAGQYPDAKAALISQVRSNTMPYTAWAGVQAALGGEIIEYGAPLVIPPAGAASGPNVRTYHINYGNQNYRTMPGSADWSEDRIKQQLAVIDQLIAAVANMETLQFLQEARLGLAGRVNK